MYIIIGIVFVLGVLFFLTFFIVKQKTAAIIERFGKFQYFRNSGIHFKIPVIDRIAGRINLKVQQLDVNVETKTKDNVFVRLKVSVQFRVMTDSVYDAFYKLESPRAQITSYVFDVVRAEVPKMKLDNVFEERTISPMLLKRSSTTQCWTMVMISLKPWSRISIPISR